MMLALVAAAFAAGLIRPHWSVLILTSLLPLGLLLPPSIGYVTPFFESPIAAIGAAGAAGAVLRLLGTGRLQPPAVLGDSFSLLALAFTAWIFVTHPASAWSGVDGRYWVLTFLQLWGLAVIARVTIDTPAKHAELMLAFAVACLASASTAMQTGVIAEARELGLPSSGYALGLNSTARYFAVAVLFLIYLSHRATHMWMRVLAALAAAVQMVGVVYTQSRSGLMLGLMAVMFGSTLGAKRKITRFVLNASLVILAGIIFLPAGSVDNVVLWFTPEQLNPNAQLNGVTENIRYYLWEAGFTVWSHNPLTGVGIGEFGPAAQVYLNVATPVENLPPHNMFVGLLSETGLVGFALFAGMVWVCVRRAWKAHWKDRREVVGAAGVWAVTIGLLVAGGLFKDDAGEKLLWIALGIAASYGHVAPMYGLARPMTFTPARVRIAQSPSRTTGGTAVRTP